MAPSGLQTLTRQVRTLGICLEAGRAKKNWALDSEKMQAKDPPHTGFSGLVPAATWAPFLPRDQAGGRARAPRAGWPGERRDSGQRHA